jgi:hypothetical protein
MGVGVLFLGNMMRKFGARENSGNLK